MFCECCAESIDSAGVPTGSVQCEVYTPDVVRCRFPEVKERFALGIIEPTEKFGGMFVQCVRRGFDRKEGSCRCHGLYNYRGDVIMFIMWYQRLQRHAEEWC